ncbi:MAG: hypothetical protein CMI27_01755 [Opitutae bacterium]|nr:hypothetical protein [Opitutae bacterium]|tara:strand:+ start:496 stop:729 length:234 start_codon:yes stop_codon:yes gene_type:complete
MNQEVMKNPQSKPRTVKATISHNKCENNYKLNKPNKITNPVVIKTPARSPRMDLVNSLEFSFSNVLKFSICKELVRQ